VDKKYKMIGWYVVVAFLAWGMWGAGSSLGFNSATGLDINFSVTLLFLLLTSLTVLGYVLFRKTLIPIIASAIIGISFLAWYGFSWLNLLGVAIMLLLNLESYRRVGQELFDRIKISSSHFLRHGLYPVVIGIFILASFALYQSTLAKDLEKTDRLPSQTQEFFRQIIDKFLTPQLDMATPKQRQSAVNEVASQAYQQLNTWFKPYFQYAPPLLAFALFLILLGLSWFFVWLAMAVGMFLFWILKKTEVVRVEVKEVKVESLVV